MLTPRFAANVSLAGSLGTGPPTLILSPPPQAPSVSAPARSKSFFFMSPRLLDAHHRQQDGRRQRLPARRDCQECVLIEWNGEAKERHAVRDERHIARAAVHQHARDQRERDALAVV